MIGSAGRLAYLLSQSARVTWFLAQSRLAARLDRPRPAPTGPVVKRDYPSVRELLGDLARLVAADLANIEAGRYRMPHDLIAPPGRVVANAVRFFRDLPAVQSRRRERDGHEVMRAAPDPSSRLPRYYRQNFHYQTDGYLSARSAELYDHQVEVLFTGGADAMRRQALVPIHEYLAGRAIDTVRLLDLGTGTGRFLTFVKDNWPTLPTTGIDLSRPYLAEARRRLQPWQRTTSLIQAAAEALPFADRSIDLATCIYLFHELPRGIRVEVSAEIARVLKPGGRLILIDSLQPGDRPRFDPLLELFPQAFHEPYYADYLNHDLAALFRQAGLIPRPAATAFMSKVMVVDKI